MNKHHSKHLQNAWNLYGEESFSVELVEEIDVKTKENLLSREQYFIDLYESYNPDKGFNMNKSAWNRLGMTRSEESKVKQSNSKKTLTSDQILEMLKCFWIDKMGQIEIAERFNFCKSNVCLIVRGKVKYSSEIFDRFVKEHNIDTK